ncbi:putative alpha/beta hydrolase family esterase [Nesterenkonia lacusekhoensis]|uniref:Alpha/beta hydrolase family esterase n=1 Tax=Nesterenkonia lacusekhoensis TaxID=150832 RepID=A0ABS4T0N5_9MICC|nr:alpha/beta hydrolase [Nesterenkonia lacusekhoensis]MBP2318021.1 putative alpha/beta hydrolase family esterase [Nesterenkonia lacusekhoensis]
MPRSPVSTSGIGIVWTAKSGLPAIRAQRPLPWGPLPAPTHVVVSDDDPHLGLARAQHLTEEWGSTVEVVPGAGRLGTADGYGRWPRIAELIEDAAAGRLWAAPLSPER